MDLISIRGISKKLGISYHAARNRLNRNKETETFKHKLEHGVVYDVKVLEILDKCDR